MVKLSRISAILVVIVACGCGRGDPNIVALCHVQGNSETVCDCAAGKLEENLSEGSFEKWSAVAAEFSINVEQVREATGKDPWSGMPPRKKEDNLVSMLGRAAYKAGVGWNGFVNLKQQVDSVMASAVESCR